MVTNANIVEARRSSRRRADAPSTLRGAETGPVDAFVHDVSQTGARVECPADLMLGDFVTIGLAGVGTVRAIVVWHRETQYGLDFVVPLNGQDAARAFGEGIVVSLTPSARAAEPVQEDEGEDGVYAEASGLLGLLLFVVLIGAVAAALLVRHWML